MSNTPKLTLLPYSMRFVGYHVCRLLTFVIYDVCCLWCVSFMTFVALLRLSAYYICRIMTFVALLRLSLMTFVANYDVCCQFRRLLPIITFVADRVCGRTQKVYSLSIVFLSGVTRTGAAIRRRPPLGSSRRPPDRAVGPPHQRQRTTSHQPPPHPPSLPCTKPPWGW